MIGEDKGRNDLTDEPDLAGESRRCRRSRVLVHNNAAGAYSNVTTFARIKNASARLRCMVAVGFRPAAGSPSTANLTGWTATLDAWTKHGTQAGFFLPENGVIPGPAALSTALPWSYEVTSLVDMLVVTVSIPNLPGTNSPPGDLWVTATWEPVSAAIIGDGELQDLFRACAIDVEEITVSESGV